jgi:hypothetical protein
MSLDKSGLAESDGEPTTGSGSETRPSSEASSRTTGAPRLFDDPLELGYDGGGEGNESVDDAEQEAPHRVADAELAAPAPAAPPHDRGEPGPHGAPRRAAGPPMPTSPVGKWPTPAATGVVMPAIDAFAPSGPRHLEPNAASTPDPEPRATRSEKKVDRPRARKVRRIVRHVDPWSVLKVSLLFYFALFLIVLVASILLWNLGRSAGTVDRVERFVTSLGFGDCQFTPGDPAAADAPTANAGTPNQDGTCDQGKLVGGFQFQDGRILQAFAVGGLVLVIAGAAANTVLALLFNIISDLTGGMRFTVLEEDPVSRASGSPR